jgi:hypothetical protein
MTVPANMNLEERSVYYISNINHKEKEILLPCKFEMQAVDNHLKEKKQVYSGSTMTYTNLNKGVKMEITLN